MKRLIGFFILVIIASLATTALQAANDGVVNAVSYRDLPPGVSISVQALDNSVHDMTLVKNVISTLNQNGYSVSDNGNLIMTVEFHDEIGGWKTVDRRHVVEFSTQQSDSNNDNTHVKFNLFNSNTGGILNKGENSGTTIITPSQYQVSITVESATDGKRLWEGWASADKGQSSNATLSRIMVPALISTLGKTVNHSTFSLQ